MPKIRNLSHKEDIKKILNNVRLSVAQLSKIEVEDRRVKSHRSKDILDKVNQDIEMINEYILVAALLG